MANHSSPTTIYSLAGIATTANLWLREKADTRKILIALNLEVIAFTSAEEAKLVLMPIVETYNLASSHCMRVLDFFAKGHLENIVKL